MSDKIILIHILNVLNIPWLIHHHSKIIYLAIAIIVITIPTLSSPLLVTSQIDKVKSRYLLLDKTYYNLLKEQTPLEFKVSTSIGDLYINLNAE